MQAELQQSFDRVEKQRDLLVTAAGKLSAAELGGKQKPGEWSIQQIVEHLVLTDETLGQVQEVTQPEPLMFRFVPRTVRRRLILNALNKDKTLPLPSPSIDPTGNVPLPELMKRWETARTAMQSALDSMQVNDCRYWHPVIGPLTAGQMLELEQVHTAYHTRQMERTYPGASADPPETGR